MSLIFPSLNPDREKRLVSSQHFQSGFGDHLASYSVGAGANRPGCKAEHSPPSSAGVRNEWSCTYIRCICLDVLFKDLSITGSKPYDMPTCTRIKLFNKHESNVENYCT